MVFDFLKKNKGEAPPDVGQEDAYELEHSEKEGKVIEGAMEEASKLKKPKFGAPARTGRAGVVAGVKTGIGSGGISQLELEKINARLESLVEWINQFYERFSYVSESIGEIRAMNLSNEKKISEATKEADKVIDIVKEVKPERLRLDYQKFEMQLKTLEEKINANKLFMQEVMNEVKDLKHNSEIFVGTEALMKLNEDTKKDLVEVQKIDSKTKMHADKVEQIFSEVNKGFADAQKMGAIVDNLNGAYSGLKAEIEGLRLSYKTVVKTSDYTDFKKTFGNKIAILNAVVSDVEGIKKNNMEFSDLIETSLSISKKNEQDIGKVAMKVGQEDVTSVTNYENQLNDVLEIMDKLATDVVNIKKKVGMGPSAPARIFRPVKKLVKLAGAVVSKKPPITKPIQL